jgi:hypothetical protein
MPSSAFAHPAHAIETSGLVKEFTVLAGTLRCGEADTAYLFWRSLRLTIISVVIVRNTLSRSSAVWTERLHQSEPDLK